MGSYDLPPICTFLPLLLPPAIPSRPPRTRLTGEQASETPPLEILYGRGAIRFLGSVSYATARHRSSTSTASSTSASPSSPPWPPKPTDLLPRRPLLTRRRPRRLLLPRRRRYCQLAYWRDIWWHIHSLMPMRDAARAACVSRTFMHSWRRHTSLTFSKKTLGMDENVCEKDGKARDLTYKVDILIEHPGIGVNRVRIEFYDYKTRAYYLERWLQIAITPGIEELGVYSSMCQKRFKFPWSLLSEGSGNSIRYLHLSRCVFCPTVGLGLRSLTQLRLFDVHITANELACLLDNSFALQQLALMHCSKIVRLKIPPLLQQLITLEVSGCKRLQAIEIEAQCLSKFWFGGERLVQLSFGEALHLKTLDLHCRGAVCDARANLPSSLPNLETLSIYSYCEMVCTPMVSSKFPFLKHLTVKLLAAPAYDYCSLISFFDASPSLETFSLNAFQGSMQHPSILGDPSGRRQMPEHRHDKLKNVTIVGFSSAKSLVELTCHILESTKSLECLTLDTMKGYKFSRCSVNRSDKCLFPMGRDAIVKARQGLLAIRTYIEGIIPSKVKFTVVEPCGRCHVVEL